MYLIPTPEQQAIKDAVRRLSTEDLAAFRAWFSEFNAEAWDRQFEADVAAGKLDSSAEAALTDIREGRCTHLRANRTIP